jgi:hypothetical protein
VKEHYVYVPFADDMMDDFAAALVVEKNKVNRFFGHHTLIKRPDQGNDSAAPLSVIGRSDRLYMCIHGASKRAGVGVYHVKTFKRGKLGLVLDKSERKEISGEGLAEHVADLGLPPRRSIDIRLWTCWGGGKENEDRDGTVVGDHDRRSFALRFAQGMKEMGFMDVTVTGYTHLVDLGVARLKAAGGKKMLQTVYGQDTYIPTNESKIQYKVSAI